jgi:hypothetical protein
MSRGVANGLEWAKTLPSGARVHWRELDAHVLAEHPQILSLLGAEGADVRSRRRSFAIVFGIVLVPAIIVALAVTFAPLWGLATLLGDAFGQRDVDGAMAIPIAGTAMVISCIVMSGYLVRRAFTRGVGGTDDGSVGQGVAVLGVLTLVIMITVGTRQHPQGWENWLVPTVLAIVLAVALSLWALRRRETPGTFLRRPQETLLGDSARRQRVRAAVALLPESERAGMIDDRQRAIAWLRMQGTITPDEAVRAGRTELGGF